MNKGKKMKVKYSKNIKIYFLNIGPLFLTFLLTIVSLIFIINSARLEGFLQNLLLGLGTGTATSALVSLVFYINDLLHRKRESERKRDQFLKDFKILIFNIVRSIEFDINSSGIFSYQDYVKTQHRWYHEYYKKMVADNYTKTEVDSRLMDMSRFVDNYSVDVKNCLASKNNWSDCGFSPFQSSELSNLYYNFTSTESFIKSSNIKLAFLYFSSFLEIVKRLPEEFKELGSFQLLQFTVDNKTLTIDYSEFGKKEPFLKFVSEFSELRTSIYKERYKKQ